MKKEHKILKFFLPLISALYFFAITLTVPLASGTYGEEYDKWWQMLIQIAVYVLAITLTLFIIEKGYSKLFPYSENYKIKLLDWKVAMGVIFLMFLVVILKFKFDYWLFISTGHTFVPYDFTEKLLPFLISAITPTFFGPIFEELSFRYMALSAQKSVFGRILALLGVSVIFGIMHSRNIMTIENAFFSAILFGTAFLLTKNICVPIVMHIGHNFWISALSVIQIYKSEAVICDTETSVVLINNSLVVVSVFFAIVGALLLIFEFKSDKRYSKQK